MKEQEPKIEEWWTKGQVELVKDKTRNWQLKRFTTKPGIWIPTDSGSLLARAEDHQILPEGGVLDNSAWDHEHCELCFEKISDRVNCQKDGYTDGSSWLCRNCYQTYIAPYRKESE
jgi:hypothetical protein